MNNVKQKKKGAEVNNKSMNRKRNEEDAFLSDSSLTRIKIRNASRFYEFVLGFGKIRTCW